MVPLQWEVTYGPPALCLGSPWLGVAWGTPQHPADLDCLCLWLPEHRWLLEHQWPLECCWLMEQLNHSILSLNMATAATAATAWQWASLIMANIPSHESSFKAVNSSYVHQLAVTNS